jgi:hypothetical protein
VQGVPAREFGEVMDMENRALGSVRSQCAGSSSKRVRGSHGWKRSEGCAGREVRSSEG